MEVPDYIISNANDFIKAKANLDVHRTFLEQFLLPDIFIDCFFTQTAPTNFPGINKIDDDLYEVHNKESGFGMRFYRANDLWLGIRFRRVAYYDE